MHLSIDDTRTLSLGILSRLGYSSEESEQITDVLVEAHLVGRPDSGLNHLMQLTKVGERGSICIVHEDEGSVLIDGANNPAFLVSSRAMTMAIEKAKERGVGIAAARNAYLGGINGYYVSMAARADMIGLMATSSTRRVAPEGGIDALMGTNPIAFAVPTQGDPIILDMSTATVNAGKVVRAARLGESISPGVGIGPDGAPTTDPEVALMGALLPFGGYKGSGLSIIVQCLGILGGGAIIPRGMGDFGYFFLVFDPARFMPIETYKQRISELVTEVHGVQRKHSDVPVRVPGERSMDTRRQLLESGIDIDDRLYEQLMNI
jgi:L-2-hydroxycarboxylate dehydrogenase (NAD+)